MCLIYRCFQCLKRSNTTVFIFSVYCMMSVTTRCSRKHILFCSFTSCFAYRITINVYKPTLYFRKRWSLNSSPNFSKHWLILHTVRYMLSQDCQQVLLPVMIQHCVTVARLITGSLPATDSPTSLVLSEPNTIIQLQWCHP